MADRLTMAQGSLFMTNYRILFQGQRLDKDGLGSWQRGVLRQAMPVAAIARINWMALPDDVHPEVSQLVNEALAIRSKTFQLFIVTQYNCQDHVLDGLHVALSRLVFSSSLKDTFAFYTGTPMRGTISTRRHSQRNEVSSTAVRKALYFQVAARSQHSAAQSPTASPSCSVKALLDPRSAADEGQGCGSDDAAAVGPPSENVGAFFADLARAGFDGLLDERMPAELGTALTGWRVSLANLSYRVVGSYPDRLPLPTGFADKELGDLASSFKSSRFPLLSWISKAGSVLLR